MRSARSTQRSRCRRRLDELFGDTLSLRIGVNTGDVVVGQRARGQLLRDRRRGERRGAARAGRRAGRDPRRRAHRRGCSRRLRARGTDDGRGQGKGRRRRLSPARARAVAHAPARRGRPPPRLRRPRATSSRLLQARLSARCRSASEPQPRHDHGRRRRRQDDGSCASSGSGSAQSRPSRCGAPDAASPTATGITYWPLGEVLKEHFGDPRERPARDRARAARATREILGLTLGLDVAADLHPLAARDRLAAGLGRASSRSSSPSDPPSCWSRTCTGRRSRCSTSSNGSCATSRPAAAARDRAAGARSSAPDVGRTRDTPTRLAGGALPDGHRPHARRAAPGRAAAGRSRGRRRTGGGQPVLRRGARRDADRPGRARARERQLDRTASCPPDFVVPDTVQAVLAARIDLLEPAEKAALQAAAVIGRTFWSGPVYELLEGVEPDLRLLEERDFIRHRSGSSIAGEREFVIKHALTREVAYGQPAEGEARPPACRVRRLARADRRGARRARALCSPTTTPRRCGRRTPTSPGRARTSELAHLRDRRSRGSAARPSSPSAATRSTTPSLCSTAPRARAEPRQTGELWERSATRTCSTSTARRSRRRCSARSSFPPTGEPADPYSRSPMRQRAPQCGSGGRTACCRGLDRASARALRPRNACPRLARFLALAETHPARGAEPALEASELAEQLGDAYLRAEAVSVRAELALMEGRYEEAHALALQRFDLLADSTDPEARVDSHWYAVCTTWAPAEWTKPAGTRVFSTSYRASSAHTTPSTGSACI